MSWLNSWIEAEPLYRQAEIQFTEKHQLSKALYARVSEMPAHSHTFSGTSSSANDKRPKTGAAFATSTKAGPLSPGDNYYAAPGVLTALDAATVQPLVGGGQPHNNLQPYLTVNFCIALQGVFPPRP